MPMTRVLDNSGFEKKTDSFDLTDEIKYEDLIQEKLPEDIIFPEELNRYLRDRIRNLTSENGCLRRALVESEEELRNVRKNSSEIPSIAERASEFVVTKPVKLTKKCKDQTAEIEVLKSKCKNLEAQLSIKETELQNAKSTETVVNSSSDKTADGDKPVRLEDVLKSKDGQIKVLQDKSQQLHLKLCESKNSCTSLRLDLNKAHKLLCSEVGESVTIAGLSSHQSGWKGRAEQIQLLQRKVSELQNKLNEYEGTPMKSSAIESRYVTSLRNMEKERRQKAEESARELRNAIVSLENNRRKLEATKARVKILENELGTAKQSVILLNEKRMHDDQLIQALTGKLKAVDDKFHERERELLNARDMAENERRKLSSELDGVRATNEQLRRTVEERETEIESLRNGTACNKAQCSVWSHEKVPKTPLSTARSNGDYNEYVTLGIAAEAERGRLLELVTVLNRRLDKERHTMTDLEETLRAERVKLAGLETKLQRLEMEKVGMSKIYTGYKTRSSKATVSSSEGSIADETRFKLELLEEECLALKARLATIQQDKASDLAMYKQMLDQARKTFQDAYRGKVNSDCYSTTTI